MTRPQNIEAQNSVLWSVHCYHFLSNKQQLCSIYLTKYYQSTIDMPYSFSMLINELVCNIHMYSIFIGKHYMQWNNSQGKG